MTLFFQKHIKIFIALFFAAAILGGLFYFDFKPILFDYKNQENGFSLQYPEDFVMGKISEEEKAKNSVMSKLIRIDPPALIVVWKENLGMVATFSKQPILEYLRGNIDRKYNVEYNDFKKEKIIDTKFAELDAFSVWFIFRNPEKVYMERIKLIVGVKDTTAYYFQCMAPVEMWKYAEKNCDRIAKSFKFI